VAIRSRLCTARLEQQLLAALEQRLSNPEMIEYTLTRFQEELQKRPLEIRAAPPLEDMRRERRLLRINAKHLTDAIAGAGHSPTLLSKLGEVEAHIARLDRHVDSWKPMDIAATVREMRDFVSPSLINLRGLLHEDASRSKAAFSRHLGQLVLKPKQTPAGPLYEVSGGLSLLAQDVMPVVARDGIEPPTPAFSGLRSTS
jgi:hypothetical protein